MSSGHNLKRYFALKNTISKRTGSLPFSIAERHGACLSILTEGNGHVQMFHSALYTVSSPSSYRLCIVV